MKKTITILSIVLMSGIFSAFTTYNNCVQKCCETEICKQNCIDSKCCKEEKTCDITNGKDCKLKCCDGTKDTCDTKNKETCCKE